MNIDERADAILRAENRLAVATRRMAAQSEQMLEAMRELRAALDASRTQLAMLTREGRMLSLALERMESSGYSLADLRAHRRDARICRLRFAVMQELAEAGFSDAEIENFLHRTHGAMTNMRLKNRSLA